MHRRGGMGALLLLGGCLDYTLYAPGGPDLDTAPPDVTRDTASPAWDGVIDEVISRPDDEVSAPTLPDAGIRLVLPPDCVPGWQGVYYNHRADHPDMRDPAPGLSAGSHPLDHDWFDEVYAWDRRTDPALTFGADWWPVDGDEAGDPAHYAVHWRGWVVLEAARLLSFTLGADDDAWVLIDGVVVADQGGIHALEVRPYTVSLAAGVHRVDIFDAEREPAADGMWFAWEDAVETLACDDL